MSALLLTLVLAHGCDGVSTASALSQGARELNPLLPANLAANVSMQAVVTGVQVFALQQLARKHQRWARVLGIAAIGFEGAIVAHNLRTLRQQR